MPHPPHPDAGSRSSTASHVPAALAGASGSSLVVLSPAGSSSHPHNTDDHPTVITSNRAADAGMLVAPGGRLGHYEVIESVGAGGMAAVLKARDLELGRIVALKILPPHMARDPENVARFKQEARAAARLDHDNIARVFFCGEDQNLHFIAFEYVEGENLRVLIDRSKTKTIPAADCISYMAQCAAGLAHAALRGVVHRDVKPSNIVITPERRAKIVDMGLARSLGGQSVNGGVTQSGVTLGTFDYISPEQAFDPRRADVRSDIYSLGCAFYHALTGRPPVPEGTAAKKLYAHQHEPVTDPRVLNPSVPDELAAVLAKMMAKDPVRRYQTPAELIADLTTVAARLNLTLDGVALEGSVSNARSALGGGAFADPPRIPLGIVAAIAGIAVAIVVLVGMTNTANPTTPLPPYDDVSTTGKTTLPEPAPFPTVVPTPRRVVAEVTATDADSLAKSLQEPGVTTIQLTRGAVYDLTHQIRGVLVDGKSVSVIGVPGPMAPTIRIAAAPADRERFAGERPGTLSVTKSESVVFEGVRFELVDSGGQDVQLENPVGVAITDSAKVKFVGCRFDTDPDLRATAVAGLAVTRDLKDTPTDLTLNHCYFAVRRAVGLRLAGRVKATVDETGFAPHLTALELVGDRVAAVDNPTNDVPGGEVRLTHCTFLLDQKGAAITAEDGARWQVSSGFTVFASPPPPADPVDMTMMMADPNERRPAVIRVLADRHNFDVRYSGRTGEPNAYFHVDTLFTDKRGYTLDECRQLWDPVTVSDAGAELLKQSPWESADPVTDAFNRENREPWRALRLRTTFRPIQVPRSDDKLLGMRFKDVVGLQLYDSWPPPQNTDTALNPGEKVWYPNPPAEERGRLPRLHYATLTDALAELKTGEVLLIRHDGPLPMPPTLFDRQKLQLTVRPYPDSTPILVPATDGKADASLFQVASGKIVFERLAFDLRSRADDPADLRSRAAVSVSGTAHCTLRDCSVTLEEFGTEKLAAVVVAAAEPGTGSTSRLPTVELENCFIRGKGRGVWVQAARPFDLEVKNTIAALAGSLIVVDPPERTAPANATSQVRLKQVTAALTGSVLDLRAGQTLGAASWVPIEVSAGRCLFATVGKSAPLVTITGAGDSPDPDRYFTWKAGSANWYQNRPADAVFLEVTPTDEAVGPKTILADGWFQFTGENPKQSSGSVAFTDPPLSPRALLSLKPAALVVTDVDIPNTATDDAGANVMQVAKPPATEAPTGSTGSANRR